MRGQAVVLLLVFVALYADGGAAVTRTRVDLPTRPGVTQSFQYIAPDAPVAHLLVVRGFGSYPDAGTEPGFAEFMARSGVAVAVIDAPSDHLNDYIVGGEFRRSPEHATDILAVIEYMRQRSDVPLWLMSESNGTVSVASLALRLPPGLKLGGILGSATTVGNNSLLDMQLGSVTLPVLLVDHWQDSCFLSPPSNAQVLLAALAAARAKELIFLTGGVQSGDPCDHGFHEFQGLDREIADAMIAFIDKYNALLGGGPLLPRPAIEFYHAEFDHFFITHVPIEIALLDEGTVLQGWRRTGRSFNVYTVGIDGTSPVCRYYIPPEKGNSHFYGRGTTECATTGANNPSFVNEDSRFFHVVLPAAGICPTATRAVFRVFSNRPDANHRYMTDAALRDAMVGMGWLAEGDGPELVAMCVPL